MSGWIKLHRQLQESSFFGQPIAVAVWVHCLLRANHEDKQWFVGRERVCLQPGEFVMGYREFSEEVGCGVATLKAWLDLFEREGMVERSRNAKGTTVKLKKWNQYQDTRTLTERSRNADGTLTEPNKKVKNNKNDKNTSSSSSDEGGRKVLQKHLVPYAMFCFLFSIECSSSEEWSALIRRNAKLSKELSQVPLDRLAIAMVLAEDHWAKKQDYPMTLETVGKFLQQAAMNRLTADLSKRRDTLLAEFEKIKHSVFLSKTTHASSDDAQ